MRTIIPSLVFAMLAIAQDEVLDRREMAIVNKRQTNVTVTPNRTVYLPGEEMEAKVRITNSSNRRLEVPKPFAKENGVLFLQQRRNPIARSIGEEYGDMNPHQDYGDGSGPLDTLKPGEIVEKTFDQEYVTGSGSPILEAPDRLGDYRFGYFYNGIAVAPFVVSGLLEQWTFATYPRQEFVVDDGIRVAVTVRVFAMVYKVGSERVICLSTVDHDGEDPGRYGGQTGRSAGPGHQPIRRVATVNGQASDFKLEILNNDNFRLSWKDNSGIRLVELDKKRRVLR